LQKEKRKAISEVQTDKERIKRWSSVERQEKVVDGSFRYAPLELQRRKQVLTFRLSAPEKEMKKVSAPSSFM